MLPNASTYEECLASAAGTSRHDLLRNSETWMQRLAIELSLIEAFSKLDCRPKNDLSILDVGCGPGSSSVSLMQIGFNPDQIYGIDRLASSIESAKYRFPNIHFSCQDATQMNFEDARFDIVFESTMFIQLIDSDASKKIASEMLRVLKPNGFLILSDWKYSKPWDKRYCGLNQQRIQQLFDVGIQTQMLFSTKGALLPPIGRWLSKNCRRSYFLFQWIPLLTAHQTCVLKKVS